MEKCFFKAFKKSRGVFSRRFLVSIIVDVTTREETYMHAQMFFHLAGRLQAVTLNVGNLQTVNVIIYPASWSTCVFIHTSFFGYQRQQLDLFVLRRSVV